MASNLLTLPREIRNIIFANLPHVLEFDWLWAINEDHQSPSGVYLHDVVTVRFDNAPAAGALSANAQLRAEYLEEDAFNKTELSVRVTLKLTSNHMSKPSPNEPNTDAHVDAAFAKVAHATLYVECPRGRSLHDDEKDKMRHFLARIAVKFTNLRTLRLAFRQRLPLMIPESHLNRHLLPHSVRRQFRPRAPSRMCGLQRVQGQDGYRVGYGGVERADDDGQPHMIFHEVQKIGVWVYAPLALAPAAQRLWEEKEIVERWPMKSYSEKVLEGMGVQEAQGMRDRVEALTEWVER
jgi:hypothetical protein